MSSQQLDINEKEAREPLEKGEWQAIDIYIFSNGQEYSPPRKYHLAASELNLWDSTLNDLAKSHYGPFYSNIQLFTLDGHKVEGPLELRDGMSYVAVKTPDAFIDSGYAKYLIKASRSREKRQARKNSLIDIITDVIADVEPNFKLNAQEMTQKQENVEYQKAEVDSEPPPTHETKIEKEITQVNPISDLAIIKTPDESLKECSVFVQPSKLNSTKVPPSRAVSPKPLSSSNRSERNRASVPRTSTAKSPGLVTTQTKKTPNTFKNTFQKKTPSDPNRANKPLKAPEIKLKTIAKRPPSGNLIAFIQRMIDKETLDLTLDNNEPQTEKPLSQVLVTALNENITTESTCIQKLTDKEIGGKALDNNQDEAETIEIKSVKLETSRIDLLDGVTLANEKIHTHVEQATCEVNTTDTIIPYNNSKMKLYPATEALQSKGVAVNLSVKIDLLNDDHTQSANINDIHKVSSVIDLHKKENALILDVNKTNAQSKSLQSIISCKNGMYATVVVMQCSCYYGINKTVPRAYTMPVYKDENVFFVLLPTPVLENNPCCTCDLAKENNEPNKNTISVNTNGFEDVPGPMIETIITHDVQKEDTAIPTAKVEASQTEKAYQAKTYDMRVVEKKISSTQDLCISENCEPTCSQIAKKTNTVDSSTQTEWCAVMLEVKCHGDGRYSFYLPPLGLLKRHGLI